MGKQSLQTVKNMVEWYAAMGITAIVDEDINDFVARSTQTAPKLAPEPAQASSQIKLKTASTKAQNPAASQDNPIANATALAKAANTLDALRGAMATFEGCPLRFTANKLVFEDGNRDAKLMIVGEGPGKEEDMDGRPFVGPAGQLLDKMLSAIGLDRTQVYIANIVPWRPPGNRAPSAGDIAICLPFIERQIELQNPETLLLLGNISVKSLLRTDTGILKFRGRWQDYAAGDKAIPALSSLHPAYLLRQPAHKGLAWADMLALKAKIKSKADA